ncbi:MAG: hypothetical protein K0Q53_65 [Massilibacillus sp.]|jgi:hypothetical protein|nr:hypothetical protein [Massilibacillus sp.]
MGSLFGGSSSVSTTASRVSTFNVTESSYGKPISLLFGTNRVSGGMLDWSDFVAIAHTTTTESGGKGGGGVTSSNTTYTYTVAVDICLGEGQCTNVGKIWKSKSVTTLGAEGLTFFNGSVGQSPWGYMVSKHPEKALGYSGISYVAGVVDLGDSASLANYNFEVYGLCQDQYGTPSNELTYQYAYQQEIEVSNFVANIAVYEYSYPNSYIELDSRYYTITQKKDSYGNNIENVYIYKFNFDDRDDGYDREDPLAIKISYKAVSNSVQYTPRDANPRDVIYELVANQVFGCQFPTDYIPDWSDYSNYCKNNSLLLSPSITSQTQASDIITAALEATNSDAVWSQGKLKLIPYYDSLNPIYDIIDDNIIGQEDNTIVITRSRQADAYNIQPLEFSDRNNDYNTDTVYATDQGHIDQYGIRQASTSSHKEITSKAVAQAVAQNILQKQLYVRNQYVQKLGQEFVLLDPMDAVTTACKLAGLDETAVRVVSIKESKEDYTLEITFEDNPSGTHSAPTYATQDATRANVDYNADPGNANDPIIFEPPAQIANTMTLCLATAGGFIWGGCSVWASYDDKTYKRIGRVTAPSRHGVLTKAINQGYSNDIVNTLSVNLSISRGELLTSSEADAESNNTLCWVDGEIIGYQNATLTATNQYDLSKLTRGVYGSDIESHLAGSRFVRLDDAIFRYTYKTEDIGKKLYIKLTSFNVFNSAEQLLSDVEPYTYTIEGTDAIDAPSFTVTQDGENLIAKLDSSISNQYYTYELRIGNTWGTSSLVGRFTSNSYTFAAPSEGTLTFWLKAIDGKNNYSKTAGRAIVNVVNLPVKNIIYERTEDMSTWVTQGMYLNLDNTYCLNTTDILGDYDIFADIFEHPFYFVAGASITFPTIDLGENIIDDSCYYISHDGTLKLLSTDTLGDYELFADIFSGKPYEYMTPSYAKDTFVGVNVDYTYTGNAYIDIEYRVSLDGVAWSDWISISNKQFSGRYVQIKLLPTSSDGMGQVFITGASVGIDVPDIEEVIENKTIAAEITRFTYVKKFTEVRSIAPYTQDISGVQATCYIVNQTNEYFDMCILDANGAMITGKLQKAIIRGY